MPSGTYYLSVDGVGNGTGATGYTDYASIGRYALSMGGTGSCAVGAGAPAKVRDLMVTPRSGGGQVVTWQPPADVGAGAVTSYAVTLDGKAYATATSPSATLTGLAAGSTHTVGVSATNAAGTGPATTQSFAALLSKAPSAPTGLVASTNPADGSITLTWSAPAADGGSAVTGYVVSRADVDTTQQVTDRTARWSGLTGGQSYTVSVAARNAVGTGAPVTATVEIPDLPAVVPTIVVEPPGAPMTVKAKSGRKGGARPSWSLGRRPRPTSARPRSPAMP